MAPRITLPAEPINKEALPPHANHQSSFDPASLAPFSFRGFTSRSEFARWYSQCQCKQCLHPPVFLAAHRVSIHGLRVERGNQAREVRGDPVQRKCTWIEVRKGT